MPAAITIRPLLEDAAAVAVLSGDLGYPADQAAMEARLAAVLADPGHAVFGAEGEDGPCSAGCTCAPASCSSTRRRPSSRAWWCCRAPGGGAWGGP